MGIHMTDQKALEILRRTGIENIEEYCEAIAIASNRLLDCQWHENNKRNRTRLRFGQKLILGIRYDDGSKGSVDGVVEFDAENGCYPVIASHNRSHYTDGAVIEKWMFYPDYE